MTVRPTRSSGATAVSKKQDPDGGTICARQTDRTLMLILGRRLCENANYFIVRNDSCCFDGRRFYSLPCASDLESSPSAFDDRLRYYQSRTGDVGQWNHKRQTRYPGRPNLAQSSDGGHFFGLNRDSDLPWVFQCRFSTGCVWRDLACTQSARQVRTDLMDIQSIIEHYGYAAILIGTFFSIPLGRWSGRWPSDPAVTSSAMPLSYLSERSSTMKYNYSSS